MQILSTREEYIRRMEACNICPFLKIPRGIGGRILAPRCSVCGCFVRIKAKLNGFHCPLPEPKW